MKHRLWCKLFSHKWKFVSIQFDLGVMWECARCGQVHIAPYIPWFTEKERR